MENYINVECLEYAIVKIDGKQVFLCDGAEVFTSEIACALYAVTHYADYYSSPRKSFKESTDTDKYRFVNRLDLWYFCV